MEMLEPGVVAKLSTPTLGLGPDAKARAWYSSIYLNMWEEWVQEAPSPDRTSIRMSGCWMPTGCLTMDSAGSWWLTSAKGNWLSYHWKGLTGAYLNISFESLSRTLLCLLHQMHWPPCFLPTFWAFVFALSPASLDSCSKLSHGCSRPLIPQVCSNVVSVRPSITTLFTTAFPSTPLLPLLPPLGSYSKSLSVSNVLSILSDFILSSLSCTKQEVPYRQ